jgi:hypothetical protein
MPSPKRGFGADLLVRATLAGRHSGRNIINSCPVKAGDLWHGDSHDQGADDCARRALYRRRRVSEAEELSSRVCRAMQAAVPNWTRSQEQCVQQFDSNFLRAKARGLESPGGVARWHLLYRNLARGDRPIDRNLTKKERERALLTCYKAAGITCSRGTGC